MLTSETQEQLKQFAIRNPIVAATLTWTAMNPFDGDEAAARAICMLAEQNEHLLTLLRRRVALDPPPPLTILPCPQCGFNPARMLVDGEWSFSAPAAP